MKVLAELMAEMHRQQPDLPATTRN